MRYLIFFLLSGLMLLAMSCKKELSAEGSPTIISVQFSNLVGTSPLVIGASYSNTLGEQYQVTAFRYYISNVQLYSRNGSSQVINGIYQLVDQADSGSQILNFPASADSLIALSFMIGVDSLSNVNNSQAGYLNSSYGMYRGADSGYYMAKLEGISPASTYVNSVFQYDIGGFQGPNNVLHTVILPFPSAVSATPHTLDTISIAISANVQDWFQGPNELPIGVYDTCTVSGPLAYAYSENYAQMFTLKGVTVKF
jgi:hypothetical protein